LLRRARRWLAQTGCPLPPQPFGMQDDTAVLQPTRAGTKQLLTTDGILYGRHFDDTASPEAAAHKLLARNLSDIAAMGGEPGAALLALILGADTAQAWARRFFAGLGSACRDYGVLLAGGDLSSAPDGFAAAHLTLTGTAGRPIGRAGATGGCHLAVTGALGGSLARGRHLTFEPRLAEGRWLAAQPEVVAMIDLSDGLGKDLPALLEAASEPLAAAISLDKVPLHADTRAAAAKSGKPALAHAFGDGEDYELLVVIDTDDPDGLRDRWYTKNVTHLTFFARLQNATANQGMLLDAKTGEPLDLGKGYAHWSS